MSILAPTPYQATVLSVPLEYNLMLAGGRGGGKSTAALLLVLRHCEQFGAHARPLIIRETHRALADMEQELLSMLVAAYSNKSVSHNRSEHVFRLGNGAIIEMGQLSDPGSYTKYQGRSYTLLVTDEMGLHKDLKPLHLLRSNLRAVEGIPLREISTANPGGAQHGYIHQNFISRGVAWHPFEGIDGQQWVVCPSVLTDNPHLDHADYERRLKAATGNDEDLLRAWLHGDWNISRGAFFAGSIDESKQMLRDVWPYPVTKEWRSFISMDWGSSAPSVVYFCVKAPGDIGGFPRNSLILIDEINTAMPNDDTAGLAWPPSKLIEYIKEKCAFWNVRQYGIGDDAYGLTETLLQVFAEEGVYLNKPQKARIAGWSLMRQMLHNAKEQNGLPGLYVSSRCAYWWRTVPFLQRDQHRVEDIDSGGPDHGADACRYAVMEHADQVGMLNNKPPAMFFHPLMGLTPANKHYF